MPNEYKPLTEEEKEAARKRFKEILEQYNAFFKRNSLNELDLTEEEKKFEERLNDKEMVARYRIAQEIEEKTKAHNAAFDEAKKGIVFKGDFLDRSIVFLLKTDGTDESKQYNIDLLKAYAEHPVEMFHNRVKNLMNFDPTQLIAMGNDKVKLSEYYRDHLALCHEANEFGDGFDRKDIGISKELQIAKESMKGMIQNINYVSTFNGPAGRLDFFAMPVLSPDKADLIIRNTKQVFGENVPTSVKSVLFEQRNDQRAKKPITEFYKELSQKGVKVDKNVFLKYKFVETNPETNEQKLVGVYTFLAGKPNVTAVERTNAEILKLNEVSKAFQDRYRAEFQERLGNKRGNQFNMDDVETEMKGGFFARIFRKPSTEFKEYMTALKDYNDPTKKNYLNKDNLKAKAEAYMTHVNRGGKPINKMDSLRQKRANMVLDTLSVVNKMEQDDIKIRGEINKTINDLLPKDLGVPKNAAIENGNEIEDDLQLVEKDNKIDFSIASDEKSIESA